MIWIVGILQALLFLGGIARLILFLRSRGELMSKDDPSLGRRRLIALAIFNTLFASFGFFLLITRTEEPFDILVGTALVGLIFEVAFRKGSVLHLNN